MRLRSILRKLSCSSELMLSVSGDVSQGDNLKPSEEIITTTMIGGGDYDVVGKEFFDFFLKLGKLQPNEKVLDVGCGLGRMAMPLIGYLRDGGSYEGFDIVSESINWCKLNITTPYTNFCFQLSDVYNKQYNPAGRYKASEYRFPYDDETFGFVFLTSVFTHMLPPDMENYMHEIRRVLRKDGRCFITFFLLNDESLYLMNDGQSREDFRYDLGEYRTIDANVPEYCVAYDETFILDLYERHGLSIIPPVHYGLWCGRKDFTSYQDIIVAMKEL